MSDDLNARFDEAGNHPVAWAFVAENLLIAAQLLEDDFAAGLGPTLSEHTALSGRLQGPILMLRGAGMECLLKALLLVDGHLLASGGKYRSPGGASHDLEHLAGLTKLPFSEDERWLLKYLGFWINQGRYPVPNRASDRNITRPGGVPLGSNWKTTDEVSFRELRRRLTTEVGKRMRYGPPSEEAG